MEDFSFLYDRSIIQTISILGAIQGLVLGVVVLFYPRIHRTSNLLLSLFIFSVALILLAPRLNTLLEPELMWPIYGLRFSPLILLYLYIQSLFKHIHWSSEWWSGLFIIAHMLLSFVESKTGTAGYNLRSAYDLSMFVVDFGTIVFYFIQLFRVLKNYKRKIEMNFSTLHRVGYHFATHLVWGFIFMTGYQLFTFFYFGITGNFRVGPVLALINTSLFVVFLYYITIRGKLSPVIYKLRRIAEKPTDIVQPSDEQGQNTQRINRELDQIAANATLLLREQKIYLHPQLTLKGLAEKLGVKSYLLSQAINQCLGKTFFELVNEYRVEEAKRLILDEKFAHLSILGIGFEAGFNSKTTFNTTFKRVTGMSPNEFKKQHFM